MKAVKYRLGSEVYEIFTGESDEDAIVEKITNAFAQARKDIADAENKDNSSTETDLTK